MKIRFTLLKPDDDLHAELIERGWIPLREPRNLGVAILLSIPLMVVAALISIGIISVVSTISFEEFGFTPDSFSITINLGIIFLIILVVVLHELLHLVFIPNFLRSQKTFVGLNLLGGFVISEDEIARSRYILITIAPFIIISVILPVILGVLGLLTSTVKLLIILNAMASSVDILNLLLITKQVPKKAILRSNGPRTYWKNK
ncbi:MAG TPA: DUF3267 domain-containing protein [Chloroflexi bacterium]|nr:DUF3267 domain-containing protein [Chloroflexota bacterium]